MGRDVAQPGLGGTVNSPGRAGLQVIGFFSEGDGGELVEIILLLILIKAQETEIQRRKVSCPRSHRMFMAQCTLYPQARGLSTRLLSMLQIISSYHLSNFIENLMA